MTTKVSNKLRLKLSLSIKLLAGVALLTFVAGIIVLIVYIGGNSMQSRAEVKSTSTWTGATSTNWATAGNWSPASVPGTSANVNIPGGLSKYPVVSSSVSNVASITVNSSGSGATLTIAAGASLITTGTINVNATGTLIVTGGLIKSSGQITITGTLTQNGGTCSSMNTVTGDHVQVDGYINLSGSGIIDCRDFAGSAPFANFNITGGTITIHYSLESLNFHATGGTVEFVGNADAGAFPATYTAANVQLFNVLIDANVDPNFDNNKCSFAVGGNWTNNSATASLTGNPVTVVFNGSSNAQTIGGSVPTTFYNLTFNNTYSTSPQITLGKSAIVKDTLRMVSGIVNLATDTLTLGGSGTASALIRTASSTTNWFYRGLVKRYWLASTAISSTSGNYYGLFPVGTANASSYRPVEINSTANPTAGGYFTVIHIDSSNFIDLNPYYNDGSTNIQRISKARFKTSISGVTGGTYNINITMTGYTSGNLSDYRLAIYTGGTTASAVGTHAAATGTYQNPTVKRTGITTISNFNNDFRIASTNSNQTTLPVELTQFYGKADVNKVDLFWSTASETNNDYFTIERGSFAKNFIPIGTVHGAGNSNSILDYTFTDTEPLTGINLYRLKQTDFDGASQSFNVIMVDMNAQENNAGILVALPNPFNDAINVGYTAANDGVVEVKLFDISGKELKTFKFEVTSGSNNFVVNNNNDLPAGIYMLGIMSENKMTSLIKMIKTNS